MKLTKTERAQARSASQAAREQPLRSRTRRTSKGGPWRCMKCGVICDTLTGKVGIETHVDGEHGGGRYEVVLEEPDAEGT